MELDPRAARRVVVSPAMCGPTMLFAATAGDWTWQAVADRCGVDPYTAHDSSGAPSYLAFYYVRLRGGVTINPRCLTFGDELTLVSGCYDVGARSVLTLHRLARAGGAVPDVDELDLDEFYVRPREDCLYVETFNQWVGRRRTHSNADLRRSSPVGFSPERLPKIQNRHSPRWICRDARRLGTFRDVGSPDYVLVRDGVRAVHPVDVTRDLNGVGLVYFASFFAIVDGAVWKLWQLLGRDERDYLAGQILDYQICYLGNADPGSTLEAEIALWRHRDRAAEEIVDVTLRERGSGRLIAITTQRLLRTPVPAYAS